MSDRIHEIACRVADLRGMPVGTAVDPTGQIEDIEFLLNQLDNARRWSRAWKSAAVWRFHTGHHRSWRWHVRRGA